MKQVILIRGGESFKSDEDFYEYLKQEKLDPYRASNRWSVHLDLDLGNKYEVILPNMPARENGKYEAWKIWFEKHFEFLKEEVVLIGYSLGGTFLLKYLSENPFPKKIAQLHFVAPWIGTKLSTLEDIDTFAFDVGNLHLIKDKATAVHVWQSKDDFVVPFTDGETVHSNIPGSQFYVFEDRNHFIQNEFHELLEVIKRQ